MFMLKLMFQQKELIWSLIFREIASRYKGAFLGAGWYVLNSLMMLIVYTFVFGTVLKAPWPRPQSAAGSVEGFVALAIFCGLIVSNIVSECLSKAPTAITGNPNYVKKVVFPLEVLSVVSVGAALFNAAISWLVLIAMSTMLGVWPTWTFVFAPLVIIPLIPFVLGSGWFLSSLGVYLRDVAQVVPLVTTVMLYLSPAFFPITLIPEPYRAFALVNPITLPIIELRSVMFDGRLPDFKSLLIATLINVVFAWLGYQWFKYTKRGFADVL
jgi:lipopolysaccharide transport system permease protein